MKNIITILLIFFLISSAKAEYIIYLKNGNEPRVQDYKVKGDEICFEMYGGEMCFSQKEILKIFDVDRKTEVIINSLESDPDKKLKIKNIDQNDKAINNSYTDSSEEMYKKGMNLIYSYEGDGDILKESAELFANILRKDARNDLGYSGMGRVCFWGFYIGGVTSDVEGIRKYGLAFVDKGLEHNPNSVKLHATKSELLRRMKNFAGSQEEALTALKIAPDDPDAIIALAHVKRDTQKYEEALKLFFSINLKSISHELEASINRDIASAYDYNKEYDNAIKYFRKALSIKKDSPWVYNNMGNTYKDIGDYEKAIECYNQALKIMDFGMARSNRAETQYLWGQKYYKNKEWEKALEQFYKVYEYDNKYEKIRQYLSLCHYNCSVLLWGKDWDNAKKHLALSVEFDPDSKQAKEAIEHLPK